MSEINVDADDLTEKELLVFDLVDCVIVASILSETEKELTLSTPVELRNTQHGIYALPFNPYIEGPVTIARTEIRAYGKASKTVANHYTKWMKATANEEMVTPVKSSDVDDDIEDSVLEKLRNAIKSSDRKLN